MPAGTGNVVAGRSANDIARATLTTLRDQYRYLRAKELDAGEQADRIMDQIREFEAVMRSLD